MSLEKKNDKKIEETTGVKAPVISEAKEVKPSNPKSLDASASAENKKPKQAEAKQPFKRQSLKLKIKNERLGRK